MTDSVYFSKVEFRDCREFDRTRITLLNIHERELSFQVLNMKRRMPAIEDTSFIRITDSKDISPRTVRKQFSELKYGLPAKKIINGKNEFEPQYIRDDYFEQEVVFSYAIKLTDEQVEELLPYCNALDFEPYRDKKRVMNEGLFMVCDDTYGDITFMGITDSHIPMLELIMDTGCDEDHSWPSERLYEYLVSTFFKGKEEFRRWGLN